MTECFRLSATRLPGIPDLPGGGGVALVVPGGIDQAREIVSRAPTECVFCRGVVHPVGMIAARNPDRFHSLLVAQIRGKRTIIDGFIHADVEGLAANARISD